MAITEQLKRINGSIDEVNHAIRSPYVFKTDIAGNAYHGFKFLDQINDFPCVFVIGQREFMRAVGSNIYEGEIQLDIRGYVHDGEIAPEIAEDLADDIEYILESLRYMPDRCNLAVMDIFITEIRTDEGLLAPYGVCDLKAVCRYTSQIG